MNLQTLPATVVIEGEVIANAVLDVSDMSSMNFARQEFDKLAGLLMPFLDLYMCRYETGIGCDLARHIEQIRIFSGNFCWKHRHIGNSHDAVNVGGAQQ